MWFRSSACRGKSRLTADAKVRCWRNQHQLHKLRDQQHKLLLCASFLFPAAVPALPSRPTIAPELVGQNVHLRCSFTPPPWSQPLGFLVTWARRISHSMKVEIRQESTLKPYSLVEMDGVQFRLGETVIPARMHQGLTPTPPPNPQITLTSMCRGAENESNAVNRRQAEGGAPNQLQAGAFWLRMLPISGFLLPPFTGNSAHFCLDTDRC